MTAIQTHHAPAGHSAAHGDEHHIAPWQVLLFVLVILLLMTVLTVYTALRIDLGAAGNTAVALAIALFKSALVVGFFMHLHWDNKFNAVVLLFCILAIGCFLTFTIVDLTSRGYIDPIRAEIQPPPVVKKARDAAIAEGKIDPATGLPIDEHGHGEPAHAPPGAPAAPAAPGAHTPPPTQPPPAGTHSPAPH